MAVLGSCTTQQSALERSRSFYREANFEQAFWTLEEVNAGESDDPVLNRQYWKVRLAYYLRRGQQNVFSDHEVAALADLEKALALDPENAIAKQWIAKAKAKLAAKAVHRGDDARLGGELDQALLAYKEALDYVPGHRDAIEGMQAVTEVWNGRREKARDHYMRGVRTLAQQLFAQALYHMQIAVTNDPSLEAAERQQAQAKLRLAEARFARAEAAAKDGHMGAALLEYEILAREAPDLPGVQQGLVAMKSEVEAERLAREGEMEMVRGNFDQARKLLERAYDQSTLQRGPVNELLVVARERGTEHRYLAARDLELERRLDDALAAYRAIEADWPGFLDVKTRISELTENIRLASAAYAAGQQAEQQGDVETALKQYRDALLFYPGYQDLDRRIEELKAKQRQQRSEAQPSHVDSEAPPAAPGSGQSSAQQPAASQPATGAERNAATAQHQPQ